MRVFLFCFSNVKRLDLQRTQLALWLRTYAILFCSNSTVTVTLFSLGIVNMFPYWLKQSVASLANNRGLSNFKQVQESQPYTQGNKRICCCVTWPPCCRRCDGLRVLFWFGLNYLDGHQVKRETKACTQRERKQQKKSDSTKAKKGSLWVTFSWLEQVFRSFLQQTASVAVNWQKTFLVTR